ncbi:MAG: threonylcarbamoyl-AMP synthase, partial [Burkholderiaceae bacterium]
EEIRARFESQLAGVVDAGACAQEPTTVVDLTALATGGGPVVLRAGRGDLARLGL